MLKIEIDGKKVEVEHGTTIIDAADQLGIAIPRFCYHKKLSVAANCLHPLQRRGRGGFRFFLGFIAS